MPYVIAMATGGVVGFFVGGGGENVAKIARYALYGGLLYAGGKLAKVW